MVVYMKIANICRYFYPFEGGVETFNLNLTKYLAKQRHETHIFTTNFPKNKKQVKGINIHRYNFIKFLNEPLFWFYSDLKKLNPDFIHVQYPSPWCHFWGLIYCLIHKKKMIVTYHAKPISSIFAKIGGWLYDRLIFFPFAGFYKKLVYTYSALGSKLKNSTVIPTGIDEKRFEKIRKIKKEFDLLYVGRIEKYKRIDWLLKAGKKLNLRIAIIGSGPYLKKLKKLAYKLKSNVIFFGKVNNKRVHNIFQKSKVFVLPSRSEGMPLSIPEALACGVPVLAARVGGIPDILEDRFLFDNYQEFIAKLRKVIAKLPKVKLNSKYFVKNINKEYERLFK